MNVELDARGDGMRNRLAGTLLTYLLGQRNPVRARVARDDLAFTLRELGVALRSLQRRGLARSLRLASPGPILDQHLFLEATPEALADPRAAVGA